MTKLTARASMMLKGRCFATFTVFTKGKPLLFQQKFRPQELCESRGGRPGLRSLISLRFLWTLSNTQPTVPTKDFGLVKRLCKGPVQQIDVFVAAPSTETVLWRRSAPAETESHYGRGILPSRAQNPAIIRIRIFIVPVQVYHEICLTMYSND